jgi:hypothetical protein
MERREKSQARASEDPAEPHIPTSFQTPTSLLINTNHKQDGSQSNHQVRQIRESYTTRRELTPKENS